jgi:hypothetical protein
MRVTKVMEGIMVQSRRDTNTHVSPCTRKAGLGDCHCHCIFACFVF